MRRAFRAIAALAMIATVLTAGGAVAPPAGAANGYTIYYDVVNKAANYSCLDGTTNTGNGTPVQTWECSRAPQQNWAFQPSPAVSGAYQIVSKNTGLCLDATSQVSKSTAVRQSACSTAAKQQAWVPYGNLLINANSAGTSGGGAGCLQVEPATQYDGATVDTAPCTNAALQQWTRPLIGDVHVVGCHTGLPTGLRPDTAVIRMDSWDNPACAAWAHALGIKIYLDLQYLPSASIQQTQQYIASQLYPFMQYSPWAVSIINEPDTAAWNETPAHYSQVWKAVEPILEFMMPNTIRVGGEISPWGFSWLVNAMQDGLPGVQAIGFHPYPGFGVTLSQAAFITAYAHGLGLQAFMSEGLNGPGVWLGPDGTWTPSQAGWTVGQAVAIGVDAALEFPNTG